jgi:hypothetical protein
LDPINIAIFVAAFVLLLYIGRRLARSSEIHSGAPSGSVPISHPVVRQVLPPDASAQNALPETSVNDDGSSIARKPAATGKELGFPVKLPPVRRDPDGKYNRPNFLNYYFGKIDMVTGPTDPSSFFDELHIEAQDPASGHVWQYEYTVASPAGMQQVMSTERFESLYFDAPVIIVARWDLKVILQTVTEEIMKAYGKAGAEESATFEAPAPDYSAG